MAPAASLFRKCANFSFLVEGDLAVTFQFSSRSGFSALFRLLFPSHGFEYVLQCLDIEDDLFYRRGPLLVNGHWVFSTSTSKQAPEVWYAFRTEALPSLSRLLSISTAEVLRLLTDVTPLLACPRHPSYHSLSQSQARASISLHTLPSPFISLWPPPSFFGWFCRAYHSVSPRETSSVPVWQSSLELFVYIRV